MKRAIGRLSAPVMRTALRGRSLNVLCYHRVLERVDADFFPDVVSATPTLFGQQLDLISEKYSFIAEEDLVDWLGGGSLPPHPVLLTFDDGYVDNYEIVFPILRKRGIPATFFLATGHMETGDFLWWDLATHIIARSELDRVDMPLLGVQDLQSPGARSDLARRWVRAAKGVTNRMRLEALDALSYQLDVTSTGPSPRVALTWDQAREMADNGMTFGGHTRTHPILSRMGSEEAQADIHQGISRMKQELDRAVTSFAFPNGEPGDFDFSTKEILEDLGVSLAFSLVPGPALLTEVREDPLAVRRIYVGSSDDLERLELKLLGWSRIADFARRFTFTP